jgi:hypothetical protein
MEGLEELGLEELDDAILLLKIFKRKIRRNDLGEFFMERVRIEFDKNTGKVYIKNIYDQRIYL